LDFALAMRERGSLTPADSGMIEDLQRRSR